LAWQRQGAAWHRRHDNGKGRHDNGQHGDGKRQQVDRRHDDVDGLTAMAKDSRATGGMITVTVGMTMARGSRVTGDDGDERHDDSNGWHNNGRHDDGKGQQGGRRHDDGDGRHNNGPHDNGKGQKEAAAPPPAAYQPQHHRQNVYKSRQHGLI
jgi:hypothetical protein